MSEVSEAVLTHAQGTETQVGDSIPAPEAAEVEQQVEAKPETKEDPQIVRRLAYLAKQEKALRERERAVNERLKKAEEYETISKQLDENPLDYLEKKGWDYNKITEKVLSSAPLTVEQKLEMLEKKLAEKEANEKRAQEELAKKQRQQQEQAAIEGYKNQLVEISKADTEKYDLVNRFKAHDLALEIAEAVYIKHKKVIPPNVALEEAEKVLESEYLPSLQESTKLRKMLGAQEADRSDQKAVSGSMTLTNRTTASPTAIPERRFKSTEESLAEAAKLLKWND